MSTVYIAPATAEGVELLALDGDGAPVTGATGLRLLIRRADGLYYDWTDAAFKARASVVELYEPLVEVDPGGVPGLHGCTWPGAAAGAYLAIVDESPSGDVANVPATLDIRVGQLARAGDAMDLVADAFDAAAVAASAVTELQAGLATAAAVAALPTASSIAAQVTADHGSGSYVTATGFAVAGDIPSAATISDAIWDELLASHAGAGSAGAALAAAAAAAPPSASAIAAAVWATAEGTPSPGTFGYAAQLWRRMITNRTEVDTTAGGRERLFGDDGVTVLLTWTLRDGTGGPVTTPAGSPASRGAAT